MSEVRGNDELIVFEWERREAARLEALRASHAAEHEAASEALRAKGVTIHIKDYSVYITIDGVTVFDQEVYDNRLSLGYPPQQQKDAP